MTIFLSCCPIQYKMEGYYYGAPEPVSRPNNYRDRLLLATACCCCCGLAAAKCSQDVSEHYLIELQIQSCHSFRRV